MKRTNAHARVTTIYRQLGDEGRRNKWYIHEDPIQYFKITNKKKYVDDLVQQAKDGKARGTCLRENLVLFASTFQDILEGDEKWNATDAKFIHYNYINPNQPKAEGNHFMMIVKINNIWYVRDHSNNVNEQRLLHGYLSDRSAFKMGTTSYLPIQTDGRKSSVHYRGVERMKPLDLTLYIRHNIIVMASRAGKLETAGKVALAFDRASRTYRHTDIRDAFDAVVRDVRMFGRIKRTL